MSPIEFIIFLAFIISESFMIFIWIVYFKFKLSIKHPNNLFFNVITVQILEYILSIICIGELNTLPSYTSIEGNRFTVTLQYLMMFLKILRFHYIIVMNIEILFKLKKRLILKNKTRVMFYNIYSFTASVLFSIFGRSKDDFLKVYKYGSEAYSVYLFIFCTFIIWFTVYFYFEYFVKIKSQNLKVLLILNVIGVSIFIFQTFSIILTAEKVDSSILNECTYFIISIQGIIIFITMCGSRKIRRYFINTILCQKNKIFNQKQDEKLREDDLIISLMQNPNHMFISANGSGLFSDTFDTMTKNVRTKKVLIKIFMAVTLRFGKESGKKVEENMVFKFSRVDIKDLHEKTHLKFVLNCKTYLAKPKEMAVVDCDYNYFSEIREKYLISSIFDSLIKLGNYQKLIYMISESGGRSSSFIFTTIDNQFVLKTVTKDEFLIFKQKLLENYADRVISTEKSHLVRIFAMLHIVKFDQYLILMENFIQSKENSVIFDLKGSKVGRMVKGITDPLNPPKGVVLKDVNFEQFGYKVALEPEFTDDLLNIIIKDFQVLRDSGIMDYSILLAIQKDPVNEIKKRLSFIDLNGNFITLGIIDIFQDYNIRKQGESAVKSLFNKACDLSSIDPEQYFLRICDYLHIIFL